MKQKNLQKVTIYVLSLVILNNNKELYFTATMNETSDYQFDNQMSMSENLSNMFKTQNDLIQMM